MRRPSLVAFFLLLLAVFAISPTFAWEDSLIYQTPFISDIAPTNALSPHIFVNPEVRTAAPTRSRMDSDRPHLYIYATALFDTPRIGSFGLGYWSDSELTRRTVHKHRQILYENDVIPFYRYVWRISPEWRLRSDIIYDIKIFGGYKGTNVPDYHDICYYGQLDNPYLTPYTLLRRMLVPNDDNRFDFRIGLMKPIHLPWAKLTLTPGLYTEGGNGIQCWRRYGDKPWDGKHDYKPGVNSIVTFVKLVYPITSSFSAYFGVEDFHIVRDDARDIENTRPNDPTARADMFLAVVGLLMNF